MKNKKMTVEGQVKGKIEELCSERERLVDENS